MERRCQRAAGRTAAVVGCVVWVVAGVLVGCSGNGDRQSDDRGPAPVVDGGPVDGSVDSSTPEVDAGPALLEDVTIESYPLEDGSTSTLPLARAIACELLGLSFKWQPGLGSEGEAEIVPDAKTSEEQDLADKIMARIVHNKTHQAYLNVVDGVADLITVANPPSPEERAYATQRAVTLSCEPLALDALVVVVNASNTVTGLTTGQIQKIFMGQITNWSEVGGAPGEIHPYVRPTNSGSQQLMNEIVMQGLPMGAWPPDREIAFMGGLIDKISTDPQAIGYSVYYWVTYQYPQPGYSVIAVDGVNPAAQTIGDRSYPFTANVWMVTRSDLPPTSLAHQLHDWLLTGAGQDVVSRSGYVPIGGL